MLWLLRHLIGGYALRHPLRAIVTVIAILIGVALGYAVHLINASALGEFSAAVRQVSGEADASIGGPRDGFSEAIFGRALRDPAVQEANPVLEVDAVLVEPARLRGRTLPVVGIDALRAARLAPDLLGTTRAQDQDDEKNAQRERATFALLDDGLFLSPAALASLQLAVGDTVAVQVGSAVQPVRIAGRMPRARTGQVIASMDLGFAQWRFGRLGQLTRIDLQLDPGAPLPAVAQRLALPAGVFVTPADAATARMSNLSRAYRVNLNVLALVALFTGSFLVYSLQAQAVATRRTQLAFLRVLGATRGEVQRLLVVEAVAAGVIGSALGVAAGLGIAAVALRVLGGDLGGGFFSGTAPQLVFDGAAALLFFVLGIVAAAVGGWMPARDAARDAPAVALKPGADIAPTLARTRLPALLPGLLLLALAAALLLAPPLGGLALAAYVAIGLLLVAAIQFKPLLAPLLFAPFARLIDRRCASGRCVPAWLAAWRLATTPRFAALGAAGVVASFALMVAMATMVTSFRTSVDDWLGRVLPADLYVRAAPYAGGAGTAALSARDQAHLRSHPAVERADFSRHVRLLLDPARPPITLIARPVDYRGADQSETVARSLPLTGQAIDWRPGLPPPVWVSEPMVELYGVRVGGELELPLAGRQQKFFVAGVWRDYARQAGAVIVDAADYEHISGDTTRTEAALRLRADWLAQNNGGRAGNGTGDLAPLIEELRAPLEARSAEFAEPGAIRALSLRIFDRSFAVTYVLEIVAIVIGLTGIAATFSAQTFARTREFGMLRHVGVTRGQVLALLACEGLLVTALALVIGLAAGLAIAWVLVAIVNPQSFHWTMDLRLPLALIAGLIVALLVASAATALIAGRRAVSREAVLAVREDW